MKWKIKHTLTTSKKSNRHKEILAALLAQRGLTTDSDIELFLHPSSPNLLTAIDVAIDPSKLQSAQKLIQHYIDNQLPILIYGDYDADGITATAILWEALHSIGARAFPFIPSRSIHGYGLSINGLQDALKMLPNNPATCLVITVDNGIVAHEAIKWLKNNQFHCIITDHHQQGETLPQADVIVHSPRICGAGVSWMLAKSLSLEAAKASLDLLCIGTIADMMPLTGINRSIVTDGLKAVRATKRPGLIALLNESKVSPDKALTSGDINYVIAPRLNAMGRLEHAIDSLRLLCTKNNERAISLAHLLGATNRNRQELTQTLLDQAKGMVGPVATEKVIIINHPDFHEGIIGLIAGKLVETYCRPTIVICHKEGISKASARSIMGINITELISSQSHLLLGYGGHPMAAGFSIESEKIIEFTLALTQHSKKVISEEQLKATLSIDCEIELSDITSELYQDIQTLEPFGIGNPNPIFAHMSAKLLNIQQIGTSKQHLKLLIETENEPIEAMWFGHGMKYGEFDRELPVNLAFTIDQNTWRNNTKLQLMLKDIVQA